MVTTDTTLVVLQGSSVSARLPLETLRELARNAQERSFSAGEYIFRQGEPAHGLFVIRQGRVRVFRQAVNRQQATLEIFGPLESFGEMAVLDGSARSASAVAMDNVCCIYLPADAFTAAVERSTEAMWGLLRLLCQRLRRTDESIGALVFNDVHGRVAMKLLELARTQGVSTANGIEIDLNLTQRELASLVGATRESVNKILTVFRQTGYVAVRGHRISILSPEALARRCVG